MRMEFLQRNFVNTTTVVTTNTGTSTYLFDRRNTVFTAAMATTTSTTFTADFVLSSEIVHRIVIQNCNFKNFSINAGGSPLTLAAACEGTTTASWTGNSATSLYMTVNSITANTLTLIVNSNTAGDLNHTIENIWICNLLYQFEQNPASKDYSPKIDRQEYIHSLADGGTVQYVLGDYFKTKIKIEHISKTMRNELRTVYDTADAVVFAPLPTATSWDGEIYECVWSGDFGFVRRANNLESQGFVGDITLSETGK